VSNPVPAFGGTGVGQTVGVVIRRKPERFRRWTHRYGEGRGWPLAGFVVIVGSEAQDSVFLETQLVERLGASAIQLRTVGEQTWDVDREALLGELRQLARTDSVSTDERIPIDQAIELVEYEIGNGTGVAVVPPPL
jgi:hypothetical protein